MYVCILKMNPPAVRSNHLLIGWWCWCGSGSGCDNKCRLVEWRVVEKRSERAFSRRARIYFNWQRHTYLSQVAWKIHSHRLLWYCLLMMTANENRVNKKLALYIICWKIVILKIRDFSLRQNWIGGSIVPICRYCMCVHLHICNIQWIRPHCCLRKPFFFLICL